MWIKNKNTGLKWDVTIERAEELIETGEYEAVEKAAPERAEELIEPKVGKRNAKPD